MDAVSPILKIVGAKLLECKQKFSKLQKTLKRLETTLASVDKLISDRAKESRLRGKIQDTLCAQLEELLKVLNEIQETNATGVKGKASLFCGSCIGKGAAGYLDSLNELDSGLRDTLRLADSEALVVAGSAAEEMAGGAAGKHITHAGARKFWRSQYKNELELTAGKFWNGVLSNISHVQCLYGRKQDDLRRCLLGRLDVNHDNIITVNEFQRFSDHTTRTLAGNIDMMGVIKHSASTEGIRGAMVHGHVAPITALDSSGQYVATCDTDGYLRVWTATQTSFTQLLVTVLGHQEDKLTAIKFNLQGSAVSVMVAVGPKIVEVDIFSGERISVIMEAHNATVTSISVDGCYMFSTAIFPSTMAHVWKRVEGGSGVDLVKRLADPTSSVATGASASADVHGGHSYVKCGVIGEGNIILNYLEPLGDGKHVCAMATYSYVSIINFHTTHEIHRLEISNIRINYVRCCKGRVSVGYEDSNMEDVFLDPVNDPTPSNQACTFVDGKASEFRYPETFISDEIAVNCRNMGSENIEMSLRSAETRLVWNVPQHVRAYRVHCNDADVYVCAKVGNTPALIRFQLAKTVATGQTLQPLLIMSDGTWTATQSFSEATFHTSLERRHTAAFVPNPLDPTKQFVCVSAASSNHLGLFNTQLACLGRVSMRYSSPRMRQPISCIINDPKRRSIIIGSTNGKLHRIKFSEFKQEEPETPATAVMASGSSAGLEMSVTLSSEEAKKQREEVRKAVAAAAKEDQAATSKNDDKEGIPIAAGSPLLKKAVGESATVDAICYEIRGCVKEMLDYAAIENGKRLYDHLSNCVKALSFPAQKVASAFTEYVATLHSHLSDDDRNVLIEEIKKIETKNLPEELNIQETNQGILSVVHQTSFEKSVVKAKNFYSIETETRLRNGSSHCPGCRELLEGRENIVQLCNKCADKREKKNKCAICQLQNVYGIFKICAPCYAHAKNNFDLAILSMSVVGDALLIGAIPPDTWKKFETEGYLLRANADDFNIRSKLHSYVQGQNNVTGTPEEGGLFAAPVSHRAIGIIAAENTDIRTAVITTVFIESPAAALVFHRGRSAASVHDQQPSGAAEKSGPLMLVSLSLRGVVEVINIKSNSSPSRPIPTAATAVVKAKLFGNVGPGYSLAVSNHGSFLAIGGRGGQIEVMKFWDPTNQVASVTPIMKLRGHDRNEVTGLYFTADELNSVGNDRCIMQYPLSIFSSHQQKGKRKRALICDVFSSDSFYMGTRLKRIMLGSDWEWKPAPDDPWEAIVYPSSVVDHLHQLQKKKKAAATFSGVGTSHNLLGKLQAAKHHHHTSPSTKDERNMTEFDVSVPVRWRKTCSGGDLILRSAQTPNGGQKLDLYLHDAEHKVRPVTISFRVRSGFNAGGGEIIDEEDVDTVVTPSSPVGKDAKDSIELVTIPWGKSKVVTFPKFNDILNDEEAMASFGGGGGGNSKLPISGASLMLKPTTATPNTAVTITIPGCGAGEGILAESYLLSAKGRTYIDLSLDVLAKHPISEDGSLEIHVHEHYGTQREEPSVVSEEQQSGALQRSNDGGGKSLSTDPSSPRPEEQLPAARPLEDAAMPPSDSEVFVVPQSSSNTNMLPTAGTPTQSFVSSSMDTNGCLSFAMFSRDERVMPKNVPTLYLHCN